MPLPCHIPLILRPNNFLKICIIHYRMFKATRTFIFLAIFALLSSVSFGQTNAPDSAVLDMFIKGLPTGKVKLIGMYGDQNYLADSAMVDANGHFTFRRKHPLPSGYYYALTPQGKNFAFLLDDNEQFVTFRADAADFLTTMEVSGSLNTELLYQNFRFQAEQDRELGQLSGVLKANAPGTEAFNKARKRQEELILERKKHLEASFAKYPGALYSKYKMAGQNPDLIEFKKANGETDTLRQLASYRGRWWDNVDFTDERLIRTPVIANKLKRFVKEFIPQRPDSLIAVTDPLIRKVMPYKPYFQFFANWIAMQYENGKTTVMDGEAVYVHIVNNFFTPELAFWDKPENIAQLRKHVWEMEASLMGKKGPDVKAPNQYGQEKSIYEIKAPIVVVFMFSPDCEHCQKDADKIESIYQQYKGKGVEFFGIGVNTNEADWKAFVAQHKFSFTNVFDPTNVAIYAKYFVDITPELYILNKERTIVAKNLNADQLSTMLDRELKKL